MLLINLPSLEIKHIAEEMGGLLMAKVKTGQVCPQSGQYRPVGGKTEVTLVQGKRVPPTPQGATKFVMVDATKHKNK